MKLPLVCLICLTSYSVRAQTDSLPIKKANTIVLTTSLPDEELYKKVGSYLLNAGYSIDRSDATLKSISTQKRRIAGSGCLYTVQTSINSGRVRLSGLFTTPAIGPEEYSILNYGMKKSPAKASFDALDKIAVELKAETNGKLQYQVQ